jgi:integrase
MQHLNHVHRRGAVYVWRRRVPTACTNFSGFIQVSLCTHKFSTAKNLANLLNAAFYAFLMEVKTQKITRAEAQQFLSAVVSDELERIEAERYAEPQAKTPQEWRERYLDERARSFALNKLAVMGPAAHLFDEDRAELLRDGAVEAEILRIQEHISDLLPRCGESFERQTAELAEANLNRSDFSPEDLRVLSQIRLAGQADAIARCDRRNQTTPFMDLKPFDPVTSVEVAPTNLTKQRAGYNDRLAELLQAYLIENFNDVRDPAEQKKILKARRQNEAVLFQFHTAIDREHLVDIKQEDMHFYISVLNRLPKVYGRSPKDRALSVSELMERAEELPEDEVGLSSNTINRNITILNNFLKFARSRGVRPAEELFMSDLRRKVLQDERTARLAFTDEDVMALAKHPIWSGCQSQNRRNTKGNRIFKDGLYWGPILASASGARREEIMGLATDDVVLDHAVPHILIRPNQARRLKNACSNRAVPIHSRLIELGFMEYVQEMQVKGEIDLFPEFRPDSPTETYGNVFYKPWKAALDLQLAEAAGRKTFHSFRHRVVTALRHISGIDKAWVKDLVGHHHSDETDGRYRDPTPLVQLKEVVEAIRLIF